MSEHYQNLRKELHKLAKIGIGAGLLGWDQETMMAPRSATERGEVKAELSVLLHEKSTSEKISDMIAAAVAEKPQDTWEKRDLELIQRSYALSKAVPEKLVHDLTLQSSICHTAWRIAKDKNDWETVRPELEKLFVLSQEEAKIYSQVLQLSPYDALLSLNAEGNSRAIIDPLFAQLKFTLPGMVQEIVEKQRTQPPVKNFIVAREKWEIITRRIAEIMGFDFNKGRLDVSTHPFSSGTRNDTRMTTAFDNGLFDAIYSTAHETGHSVYTQQMPEKYQYDMVGGFSGMITHESQSLLFEKQVAYGNDFIAVIYDLIAAEDPVFAQQGSVDDLRRMLHVVTPSFIRTMADEATYPLHVIFRYEIEKMLFDGEIAIRDLPQIWNEKVKTYLGLDVPELKQGVLQDTHWFGGSFGYFPTYTQGALYAAQIFARAKEDLPGLQQNIRAGKLGSLNKYLEEKIHSHGQLYTATELLELATSEKPDARYFIEHLRSRYLPL